MLHPMAQSVPDFYFNPEIHKSCQRSFLSAPTGEHQNPRSNSHGKSSTKAKGMVRLSLVTNVLPRLSSKDNFNESPIVGKDEIVACDPEDVQPQSSRVPTITESMRMPIGVTPEPPRVEHPVTVTN